MNFSVAFPLPFHHPVLTKWERNRLCLKINSQLNYPLRFGQQIYFLKFVSIWFTDGRNLTGTQNGKSWLSETVSSRHKISLRLKLQVHSAFSVILKTNIVVNTIFQTNCALLNHYLDSNSETTIPPALENYWLKNKELKAYYLIFGKIPKSNLCT